MGTTLSALVAALITIGRPLPRPLTVTATRRHTGDMEATAALALARLAAEREIAKAGMAAQTPLKHRPQRCQTRPPG